MSLAYGRELGLLPRQTWGTVSPGCQRRRLRAAYQSSCSLREVAYGTFPEWWRPGGPADYHVDSDHDSHHSNPSSLGSEVEPVWVPDSAVQYEDACRRYSRVARVANVVALDPGTECALMRQPQLPLVLAGPDALLAPRGLDIEAARQARGHACGRGVGPHAGQCRRRGTRCLHEPWHPGLVGLWMPCQRWPTGARSWMRTRYQLVPSPGRPGYQVPRFTSREEPDEDRPAAAGRVRGGGAPAGAAGCSGAGSEGPGRAQFLGRDLVPVHLRLAVLRGEMEPLEALGLPRTAGLGCTQVPWNGLRFGDASCGATRSGLGEQLRRRDSQRRARGRSWAGPPTPGTQRSLVSSRPATQGACQAPAWAAGCHWRRPSSCTPCSSHSACSRWATRGGGPGPGDLWLLAAVDLGTGGYGGGRDDIQGRPGWAQPARLEPAGYPAVGWKIGASAGRQRGSSIARTGVSCGYKCRSSTQCSRARWRTPTSWRGATGSAGVPRVSSHLLRRSSAGLRWSRHRCPPHWPGSGLGA
jgi:hypothetical protein